jgi:hypothetical protein
MHSVTSSTWGLHRSIVLADHLSSSPNLRQTVLVARTIASRGGCRGDLSERGTVLRHVFD